MNHENGVFEALHDNSFTFRCHKDVACFNACCAALRLILTPYDVLRLKNRLGLTGADFMDKYTETTMEKSSRFPVILLKMNQDERKTCPFVAEDGCQIYTDRPGACRIYPLGRASATGEANNSARQPQVQEKFFLVKESHCLGFNEKKNWAVSEWLQGEGLGDYNSVNDQWLEIITSKKGLGDDMAVTKKMQMYIMACYNLERFRDFVFKSRFFQLFDIPEQLKENIASNEKALLLFAFSWLKFSLFGEKTLKMRETT